LAGPVPDDLLADYRDAAAPAPCRPWNVPLEFYNYPTALAAAEREFNIADEIDEPRPDVLLQAIAGDLIGGGAAIEGEYA
jgi:hypothetical protein